MAYYSGGELIEGGALTQESTVCFWTYIAYTFCMNFQLFWTTKHDFDNEKEGAYCSGGLINQGVVLTKGVQHFCEYMYLLHDFPIVCFEKPSMTSITRRGRLFGRANKSRGCSNQGSTVCLCKYIPFAWISNSLFWTTKHDLLLITRRRWQNFWSSFHKVQNSKSAKA